MKDLEEELLMQMRLNYWWRHEFYSKGERIPLLQERRVL
jgi:hypothetical protein